MFKLSPEAALDGVVSVETKFITEYLPYADGDYVKVYIYALFLAARNADRDNAVDILCRRLDLDAQTVDAAIDYWTERGLMARIGDDVTFLSMRNIRPKIKNFDIDKYVEFNRQAQLYISMRMIDNKEFNEYYSIMEKYDIEWQAMTLVIKYCVDLKGENVSCPYILAVARNLAEDGYRTHDAVLEKLDEYGVYYNDLCSVMSALGGRRPDHEAVKLYKKWVREYKFDKTVVLAVAQTIKRGGISALDKKLTDYKDGGLFTTEQISNYEQERKALLSLAKAVDRTIGTYYENVDPVISVYIKPWLSLGFTDKAILALAEYCMKNDLKTLSDLDVVVRDCFAAGVVSESDVMKRVNNESANDARIAEVMKTMGVGGAVKNTFRAYYSSWTEKLGMPADVIAFGATLAVGKANPFAYLNGILTKWNGAGVTTLDGAKAQSAAMKEAAATTPNASDAQSGRSTVVERYSAEELDALITHLTDEE